MMLGDISHADHRNLEDRAPFLINECILATVSCVAGLRLPPAAMFRVCLRRRCAIKVEQTERFVLDRFGRNCSAPSPKRMQVLRSSKSRIELILSAPT
jgi:hypothetical protein